MTAVPEGMLHLRVPVADLTMSRRCPDCLVFTIESAEHGYHWCPECEAMWSHLGTHGWRPPKLSTIHSTRL